MGKYSTRAPSRKLGKSVSDDLHYQMDVEVDIFMYLLLQSPLILLKLYVGITCRFLTLFYITSESLASELRAQIL